MATAKKTAKTTKAKAKAKPAAKTKAPAKSVKVAKVAGKISKPAAKAVKPATKSVRVRNKSKLEKPLPKPSLDHTVNMGPERGDNSFPPSSKKAGNNSNRAATGPAADSTSGPGGQTKQATNRGEKGSGKGDAA